MANPVPTQVRAIDPYASYNSDVANRLTRIVTDGTDCLLYPTPIDVVTIDSENITITGGKCVKDDVLIETQSISLDFSDSTSYISISGSWWNETGYYYVVLAYTYAKTQPPNEASIGLIHPSQRGTIYNPSDHLFLKCAEISSPSPGIYQIDALYDYDPSDPSIGRSISGADPNGGATVNVVEKSTNYTADPSDNTIAVSGNTTILLPYSTVSNKELRIVKSDVSPTVTRIECQGAETIEGSSYIELTEKWNEVTLIPKGTDSVWIEV